MNKIDFDKMYKNIFIPMGTELCGNIKGSKFVPNNDTAYLEYQKQKTLYRLLCNKTEYNNQSENLLDRHKICAALCIALIKSNAICCIDSEKMDDSNINVNNISKLNEQLAVAVSFEFLKQDMKKSKEFDRIKIFEDDKFIFPTPHNSKKAKQETYEDAIVRTVYFANLLGQLNLSLLAHIFFMVEKYYILSLQINVSN